MNHRLIFLLIFAADVWAAMFLLHFKKSPKTETWEVNVALSNSDSTTPLSQDETVQVWLRPQGQLGIWPETTRPLELPHLNAALDELKNRLGHAPKVRVLCDPTMTIADWGPVVLELAPHAESLSIAPLPQTNPQKDVP